jgi:hypothetical protein
MPGTMQRSGEESVDTFSRLIEKEFHYALTGPRIKVKKFSQKKGNLSKERGHTNSELWLLPEEAGLPEGEDRRWFRTDKLLPQNTVYSHRDTLVPAAMAAFQRFEQGGPKAVPELEMIQP